MNGAPTPRPTTAQAARPLSRRAQRWSIATQLIVALLVVVTTLLGAAAALYHHDESRRRIDALHREAQVSADALAVALSLPLWTVDDEQQRAVMASALHSPNLHAVAVLSATSRLVQQRDAASGIVQAADEPATVGLHVVERAIVHGRESLGRVRVFATPRWVEQDLAQRRNALIGLILALDLLLVCALYLMLRQLMLRPILALTDYAARVRSGAPVTSSPLPGRFHGELASLEQSMLAMTAMLEARVQALHDSGQRMTLATRAVGLGIWDWNVETGELVWDDQMYRLYAVRREDFSGAYDAWSSRLAPQTRRETELLLQAALHGDAEFAAEFEIVTGDGQRRVLRAESVALRGADGRAQRMVGINVDVTARRLAEDALQRSETRFRQLFAHAPVPMLYSDLDAVSIDVNQAWLRIIGWDSDDVPTEDAWYERAYPDPDYRRVTRRDWNALVDTTPENSVGPMEVVVHCKDGQRRPIAISRGRIGNGFIVSAFDLTERKRAEAALADLNASLELRVEQRTRELATALADLKRAQADLVRSEKLASLGAMVAGIAHELNTPIGNALMVATTLQDQQRQFEVEAAQGLRRSVLEGFLDTLREACQVLERNVHRSAELIASFKQVAVDQTSYQRRHFALADVVNEIAIALRPTLRQSSVTLQHDVPAGLVMDSFPGPLGQVLINLVNNAVSHAFDPGLGGSVMVCASPLDGERLLLQVADDGRGIAPEHLPRVFDPFFTTRLGQGGSGLGLHITYSLVTGLLGGRIAIDSAPGQGTRFAIDLPLTAPVAPTPGNPSPGDRGETAIPSSDAGLIALR